jgi:hypothetical protein
LKNSNKKRTVIISGCFLHIASFNANALLSLPKGDSKLLLGDVPHDPFLGPAVVLQGQKKASQLPLHSPDPELVQQYQI